MWNITILEGKNCLAIQLNGIPVRYTTQTHKKCPWQSKEEWGIKKQTYTLDPVCLQLSGSSLRAYWNVENHSGKWLVAKISEGHV